MSVNDLLVDNFHGILIYFDIIYRHNIGIPTLTEPSLADVTKSCKVGQQLMSII